MVLWVDGNKSYPNVIKASETKEIGTEKPITLTISIKDLSYSITSIEKYFVNFSSLVLKKDTNGNEVKIDYSQYNKLISITRDITDKDNIVHIVLVKSE